MSIRPVITIGLCAVFHASLHAEPATLVDDSVIDPLAHNFPTVSFSVPTVHGVTFQQDGVTTYKGWQYAAYYQGNLSDSSGKVAVARRPLPHGTWQTLVLNDYTFTSGDSHNDVVLGICPGDGSIHLSFDHHGNDLNYRASIPGVAGNPTTTAWTPALFGSVTDHLLAGGSTMEAVTYPRFIPTPSGKLLFTYRFGGSGGGDEFLYEYDGAAGTWSLVGQYTSRSGSYTGTYASGTDRNGYFDNTIFDANGRLHATWCWRETPNASSNHDLLYAYSDDVGRTWKNQLGATIGTAGSSFISVSSPGIIGWSIPQSRNYINNSAMTVDSEGRVHVVAWHLPDGFPDQVFTTSIASNSRFIHYWRGTDGIWRKNETDLTGSRAKLSADDDGRLFLIYGDAVNIRIASANPSSDPETDPANSWNDWSVMTLSGALPAGKANTVNIINDTARWEADRIISVYAQETNISGTGPTPLHILDYHVSRAAVLPVPSHSSSIEGVETNLEWTAGQEATQNDVYLGASAASIASATPSSPEYLGRQAASTRGTGTLPAFTTCYWRIDSVNASGTITKGRVWSFSTGSLAPIVTNGASTRGPGTSVTFRGSLLLPDPAATDVTLYWGLADAGENAGSWQNSTSLGTSAAGPLEVTIPTTTADVIHYRFHASNSNGIGWASPAGSLPSVVPSVSQGSAFRSYGGRSIFPVALDLRDPSLATGELVLFLGPTDGGENPAAWAQSVDLGPKAAGSHSINLDTLSSSSLRYRFRVTTVHGSSWAGASGILDPADDLSVWSRSALIDVTGYAGTESLTDFPVLVRLSPSSVPGFAYDQMLSPPHGDLRFSTPSGILLSHEVEKWNLAGVSSVWVKLPSLSTGTQLRVWWGRAGQSPPPSAGTWSAFNGVWHLDDALGFASNSSANSITGTSTAMTAAATGVIPGSASLNGTSSAVAINNTSALNPSFISAEAWVKTTSGTGTPSIFNKDNTATGRVWQFRLNAGKPDFIVFNSATNASAASPDLVNDNQFHHLCGTWDGSTIRIYTDGVLKASTSFSGSLRINQPNKAFIGRGENASPNYFPGSIDEVRLSPVARSADWIRATYDNQKPAATFLTSAAATTSVDLDGDHLPDAWEMAHFDSTHTTHPDPDSDGLVNLLEFALGTDPSSGADRPELTFVPAAAGSSAEFIYHQIAGGTGDVGTTYTAGGLRYSIEASDDLKTWHSGPSSIAWSGRREALPGGMERVGIHVINPAPGATPQVFTRLRVLAD